MTPSLRKKLARVRLFLCDVDGVLTDGTVWMGGGVESKRFHIPDGLGMRLRARSLSAVADMKRSPTRSPIWRWACAPGISVLCALAAYGAPVLEGPIVGFSVDEADRATGRRRWLLRAERAQPLPVDRYQLTGTRLEMYDEAGGTNLVLMAPRCFFDPRTRTVSSPDTLQVSSGAGGFAIEGQGFGYVPGSSAPTNQVAGILTISNQVHATVRKDFVNTPTDRLGADAAGARPSQAPDEVVHIYSRWLALRPEVAVFRDDVRVDDSDGTLACEVLTARFTERDWRMQSLAAEENVRMESGEIRAEAGRAAYDTATDLLELSGSPLWRMGGRAGHADQVVVDRRRRHLKATGDVAVTLPAEALAADGAWLPQERSERGGVQPELKPIQVLADEGEFQPEAAGTNVTLGVFRGNVRVRNERGQLACERLTVATLGRDYQVQTMIAEQNIIIEQGKSRVTCTRAEYAAQAGAVELTGRPTWRIGEREGESDRLWLDLRNKTYRAIGQVKMRLPAGALGSSAWLLPVAATRKAESAATEAAAIDPPQKPVELTCDEFEFRSATAADPHDRAVYQGNVQVTDREKMHLTCATLAANMAPGSNQVQTVLAERKVVVRIFSPTGEREARGDAAAFAAATSTVELTATNQVEIVVNDARGSTRATGKRAVYDGTRDTFELDGRPVVVAPQGVLNGDRVQVDQARTTLAAYGPWALKVPLKTLGIPEDAINRLADPLSKQPR
jgi:lipopolysaccharide export system protein LptA